MAVGGDACLTGRVSWVISDGMPGGCGDAFCAGFRQQTLFGELHTAQIVRGTHMAKNENAAGAHPYVPGQEQPQFRIVHAVQLSKDG